MIPQSTRQRLMASSMICGAALAAVSAGTAAAQTPAAVAQVEEIVVTGSRIARPNFDSPTPVTVIDNRTIEATGALNTGDIVRQLPAAGVSLITPTNSGFQTAANGITTVNLRNLGEDRTLVLVNGRRFVPGLVGTQVVDFNTIPTELVDRVDVVTGGASATYGSDALAGVVNIITKKHLNGIILNAQYGISERHDDERTKFSLSAGRDFDDGKGSLIVSLGYTNIGSVFAKDRADQGVASDSADDYDGDPANYKQIRSQTTGLFSSFTPIGTIEIPRTTGGSNLLRVVQADGTVAPYSSAAFGFNRQAFRILQVPLEQVNGAGYVNYEFNRSAKWFAEVNYVDSKLSSQIEPTPLGSDAIYGSLAFCTPTVCQSGTPITSAVVPETLRAAVRAANPGLADSNLVVGFRRRLNEIGPRGNEINRNTFRAVTGFEGEFADTQHYELSVNYGRTNDHQTSSGDIDAVKFGQALDVITVGGQQVCRDVAARATGCVPINVFGAGKISPAAAQYVTVPTRRDAFVEELVVGGYVRGDLFKMPAGPVGYAAGAEYRRERSEDVPDALTQAGLTSGNATPATRGKFEVSEFYGELRVPLLADMAFAKALDLNLAARLANYSTVGTTDAYAASLEYTPMNWVKFRAQYSKAVRAPNIGELYQPAQQDFPTVNDPCAGVTRVNGQAAFFNTRTNINNPAAVLASGVNPATIGNVVATSCLADPAVAARVARDGGLSLTQPEQQGVTGFDGGNSNLQSEEGDSMTVGFLFNSRGLGWLDNFSLSVDYYKIKIRDRISTISEDKLLTGCYGPAGFSAANTFCSSIGRFPNGPQVGALDFVNQVNANFAETDTRGLDIQLSYRQNLNDLAFLNGLYAGDRGMFTANLTYGYLEKLTTIPFAGADPIDYIRDAGTVGAPRNKGQVALLYQLGRLQLSWTTQLVGEVVVTKDVNDFYYNVPLMAKAFHNAQVRFDVTKSATVYAGVDNLFDEYQFVGGTNGFVTGQTTGWTSYPESYDVLGRRYYAGLRMRF